MSGRSSTSILASSVVVKVISPLYAQTWFCIVVWRWNTSLKNIKTMKDYLWKLRKVWRYLVWWSTYIYHSRREWRWRHTSIFNTAILCKGQSSSLFIHSASVLNGVSQDLVNWLGLATKTLAKPYQVTWINGEKIMCKLKFIFGRSCKETKSYDVLPMIVGHILLWRSWLYGHRVIHDGYANTYTLWKDGRKFVLWPMRKIFSKPLVQSKPTVHQSSTRTKCGNRRSFKQPTNSMGRVLLSWRELMQPVSPGKEIGVLFPAQRGLAAAWV